MDTRAMIERMRIETSSVEGMYDALVNTLGHDVVLDALVRWMDTSYLKEALDDLMDDYGIYDDELEGF